MFSKIKDRATAIIAKSYIESKLGDAGTVQDLSIDSLSKKVSIDLLLTGEPTSIVIEVMKYEVFHVAEDSFVQIGEVRSSRRWIEMLLADEKIKVPAIVAKAL